LHNLRSFSLDTLTGVPTYGARLTRQDPDRYLHILVPAHMINRFEDLTIPIPVAA